MDVSVIICFLQVWLVGEDLTEHEQSMASKGTIFIPFSQFPPKKTREDCFYMNTPSLMAPKIFGNLHSCEVHQLFTLLPSSLLYYFFRVREADKR